MSFMPRGWQDQQSDPWSMFGLQGGMGGGYGAPGFGVFGALSRLGGRPGAMPAGRGALPPVAQIQGAISPYSLPQTPRPQFMSPMAPLAAQRGETQRLAQPAGFGLPDLSRDAPAGPLAPVANAPNTPKQGGVMGALNRFGAQLNQRTGFEGQDWLRLGLGLMAAGEEGGGGWGAAAETFGAVQDGARGRRFENEQMDAWREETARQRALFERTTQREDREDRTDQEREAWIAGLPEEDRALARLFPEEYMARNRPADPMITADGIAIDPRTGKQLYQVPDIVTEDEQLQRDLVRAQIDKARQGDEPPISKQFQNLDARQIYDLNVAAQELQNKGLPNLYTLRDNVQRAIDEAAVGLPVDAKSRMTLDRVFNGSSGNRAALETWNARILQPAIAMFAGTGPLSNKEVEMALQAMSNPNMTAQASLELLNERIATAERQARTAQLATQFFQQNGGLTGRVNAEGQDYPTWLQAQLRGGAPPAQPTAPTPPPPAPVGRGGAPGPVGGSGGRGRSPQSAAPAAPGGPKPGAVVDGWRFNGGDPADRANWTRVRRGA